MSMQQTDTAEGRQDTQASLNGFHQRCATLLGGANVVVDQSAVELRGRALIPHPRKPTAYLYPGSAEEVIEVVKLANHFKVPLWPVSNGRNYGYGTTTPAQDGAAVLVLERLDRIIQINEELAYAVVEPGVSYRKLNQTLKQGHYSLWADCIDGPPDGSVLANALEKGVGMTPYGERHSNLCGMRVVLPTGEVVDSGGGHAAAKTWHTYRLGTGPSIEGLFAQSNFGIVLQSGVWLMPEPETFRMFVLFLEDERLLRRLVDVVRGLHLKGVLRGKLHAVNDFFNLSFFAKAYPRDQVSGDETRLSAAAMQGLRQRYAIAPWSLSGGLYGSANDVRSAEAKLKKALGGFGKLVFVGDRGVDLIRGGVLPAFRRAEMHPKLERLGRSFVRRVFGSSPEVLKLIPDLYGLFKGIPSDVFTNHAYFKSGGRTANTPSDPARDGCGMIWFGPVAPMTGRHVTELVALCKEQHEKFGVDFGAALVSLNSRSMLVLQSILFNKRDPAEVERVSSLYKALVRATTNGGYQPYRAAVTNDAVLDQVPNYQSMMNALKTTLDPEGILAPGRYGIGRPSAVPFQKNKASC